MEISLQIKLALEGFGFVFYIEIGLNCKHIKMSEIRRTRVLASICKKSRMYRSGRCPGSWCLPSCLVKGKRGMGMRLATGHALGSKRAGGFVKKGAYAFPNPTLGGHLHFVFLGCEICRCSVCEFANFGNVQFGDCLATSELPAGVESWVRQQRQDRISMLFAISTSPENHRNEDVLFFGK